MSYAFRKGDVVHHAYLGRVELTSDPFVMADGVHHAFVLPLGDARTPVPVDLRSLSFVRWPQPVTKRPLEDGYYLARFKNYQRVYLARYDSKAKEGPWVLIGPGLQPLSDYTYHDANDGSGHVTPLRYLGESLDNFPTL